MKVAITDYSFPDFSVEESILLPSGHAIAAWKEKKAASELPELVADADAVITQFAPVNAEVIATMRNARVIVRYGIGVDNVDLSAARARRAHSPPHFRSGGGAGAGGGGGRGRGRARVRRRWRPRAARGFCAGLRAPL